MMRDGEEGFEQAEKGFQVLASGASGFRIRS
jgi:hypothetical protein